MRPNLSRQKDFSWASVALVCVWGLSPFHTRAQSPSALYTWDNTGNAAPSIESWVRNFGAGSTAATLNNSIFGELTIIETSATAGGSQAFSDGGNRVRESSTAAGGGTDLTGLDYLEYEIGHNGAGSINVQFFVQASTGFNYVSLGPDLVVTPGINTYQVPLSGLTAAQAVYIRTMGFNARDHAGLGNVTWTLRELRSAGTPLTSRTLITHDTGTVEGGLQGAIVNFDGASVLGNSGQNQTGLSHNSAGSGSLQWTDMGGGAGGAISWGNGTAWNANTVNNRTTDLSNYDKMIVRMSAEEITPGAGGLLNVDGFFQVNNFNFQGAGSQSLSIDGQFYDLEFCLAGLLNMNVVDQTGINLGSHATDLRINVDNISFVVMPEPCSGVLLLVPPQSQIVPAGSNAIFSVTATGASPLKYQWRKNGASISSATNTSLSLANIQLTNAGNYSVVVTNTYGSVTSAVASLVVYLPNSPPIIVTQPTSQFAQVGTNATFAVTAAGPTPLSYQWRFNGSPLTSRTNTSLSVTNVQLTNAGGYSVVVTNTYGSVTSEVAQLYLTVQTNRAPKVTEIGGNTIPTDTNHFKVFRGAAGGGGTLDTNKMTIVLTHGWNSSSGDWPLAMSTLMQFQYNNNANIPNIVAWDWTNEASSGILELNIPASRTPGQGLALGANLFAALGTNYAQPIHFIGHSLGTLVNAMAADYLHGDVSNSPAHYNPQKTHMTLFDEAEVAWGFVDTGFNGFVQTVSTLLVNDSTPQPIWKHPLPKRDAWADNYISLFGLLHPEAVNVILTNISEDVPLVDVRNLKHFLDAFRGIVIVDHGYPYNWYDDSISSPNLNLMGWDRSFEQGGITGAPATNTVYIQSFSTSQLDVALTTYDAGKQFLNARLQHFLGPKKYTLAENIIGFAQLRNQALAQIQDTLTQDPYAFATGPANAKAITVNLFTSIGGGSLTAGSGPHPLGGGSGSANLPAYAWLPLVVPLDAVSMSFDFTLQGDGKADRFAAALNGTNVLSLETSLIETNVTMNSGLIDVSSYAGQQVELFFGIVGDTSTNANVTVSSIRFYSLIAPSLQIQILGTNAVVTWPLFGTGYFLQATTNLTATSSWSDVTNQPVIANLQYTVTNGLSAGSRFYRLSKFSSGSPALQARVAGGNIVVSWPTSTTSYTLEATTNLTAPNSWTTVTNMPAFVDSQSMVTNPITTGSRFYRLKK
ncbi:MAG: hypothetical protein HOP33_03990 [Verrucomicrobia bacterium]|nr:hypothetical protein [Verrucomicrobiota bacterium]